MIGSPDINKFLRRLLCPALRENGFAEVAARKAWGWHENSIWVFEIRAMGNTFSQVTGWPTMSVSVWLGVYFEDRPPDFEIKRDAKGRLVPAEYLCHERSHLDCTLDQKRFTKNLSLRAERRRNDIWWMAPDGSNLEEAVLNIRQRFIEQGLPWFLQKSRSNISG